ncbi:MAG: hypothetical protein B9S32_07585 [Verrucomicrobia bacterium Tous-C9LFEB]|nr:MAG: hypothetical protein B9S32_07585 [Verrucomicrobia bacterium Tous-C9LFEB]
MRRLPSEISNLKFEIGIPLVPDRDQEKGVDVGSGSELRFIFFDGGTRSLKNRFVNGALFV